MPTIKDVAKASGVSETTVSFVLNNSGSVGPRTRERVLRVAGQLQYSPSAVARGLFRKRMDTLGIVFPEGMESPMISPYYAAAVDGLFRAAAQRGQHIIFFTGHAHSESPSTYETYRDGRCDGILAFAQYQGNDLIPALRRLNVPFVLVNDSSDDPDISCVDVDNVEATNRIVTYLLELGHTRIAALFGADGFNLVSKRRQGYILALGARGFGYDKTLDPPGGWKDESVAERVRSLMRLHAKKRPTALFCCTDEMAITALSVLHDLGKNVPGDVSVVGFNDAAEVARTTPPLTTVRQPIRQIGEQAVDTLLAQIRQQEPSGRKVVLPTEIIVRESTGPPPS